MFPREKRSVDTWLYHVSFKENFGLARRVGEFTLNGGRNERCAERVADLHGRREECRFLWRKSAKTFVPMNLDLCVILDGCSQEYKSKDDTLL